MTEPTITCPTCSTKIKLTESLAAPLIQATRQEYESKIAEKERDVADREAALRDQRKVLDEARNSINEQVAQKLKAERGEIAAEEAKKAKRAAACELDAKDKEVAELQEVLAQRSAKLEEAQKAHADVLRKHFLKLGDFLIPRFELTGCSTFGFLRLLVCYRSSFCFQLLGNALID